MSASSDYARNVAALLAQEGEVRGREAANKGAIWGGAIASIGDFIGQYPKQKAQMEEIKNRAALTQLEREKYQREANKDTTDAADEQKIRDLFNQAHDEFQAAQGGLVSPSLTPTSQPTTSRTSPIPTPSEILRVAGPKKGIPIINGLAAMKQDPQGDPEKSLKLLQQVANGLNALPEDMRAAAYPDIVKSFEQRGIIKPGVLPPVYDSTHWKFIMGTGQEPPKPKDQGLVAVPGPDGKPVYGTPQAGQPVYEKPGATPGEAKVGSFEDYVTRTYGANPTSAQVLAARKAYGQADDRPRVDVSVAGGADRLSPEAVEDTATRYRILGTSAIPTRIDAAERTRILNEAAKQTRALGQTAASSTQKQAAFKADASSLTQMQKMASSAEAFETKALAQADLIGNLSQKVGRTASPLFNSWLLSGKKTVVGDKDTALLFNALDTFTSEYAKIMSGSTGSVGATSDAATHKAEGLVSAAMNKGTLQATLDQMKWEMAQTRKGYDTTIAHITERMGGTPNTTTQTVAPPTGRYNPKTGKIE